MQSTSLILETIMHLNRILAASTYIFLASLLPALAFGEQIDRSTDGTLTGGAWLCVCVCVCVRVTVSVCAYVS